MAILHIVKKVKAQVNILVILKLILTIISNFHKLKINLKKIPIQNKKQIKNKLKTNSFKKSQI